MVNLDPTFMFRLMRDLLAASYGKTIFHHRCPTPVTDQARPKMDTFVREMGERSEKAIIHTPIADGVAASLVKNAVMMVAGASDTFGPLPMAILESPKNPRPLMRITEDFLGDLANGLFSIATQLSFYSKYGTPGDSTYAKTIVWTDLGIATASYLALGRAIAKPRIPTPQFDPPPLFVRGPMIAAMAPTKALVVDIAGVSTQQLGVVMMSASVPRKYTPSVTDGSRRQRPRGEYDEILQVLRKYKGNLHKAAKELSMSLENLWNQWKRAQAADPKGTADITPKSGRPEGFSDAELYKAMADNPDNMTGAADQLGAKLGAVSRRWKLLNISDNLILERLKMYDYDAILVARQLKIGVNDIFARIRRPDTLLNKSLQITKDKQVIPK